MDRQTATSRPCYIFGRAFQRLDRASSAVLCQPSARSNRSAHLRPRMATGLRQITAVTLVARRHYAPDIWNGCCLLCAGAGSSDHCLCSCLGDCPAAYRDDWRARRLVDHRWHALLPIYSSQVQSRCCTTAILGACRLRVSRSPKEARTHWLLAPARVCRGSRVLGKILCRGAGSSLRFISTSRSRRALRARDPRTVDRPSSCDHYYSPSRGLTYRERLFAACLCQCEIGPSSWPVRSHSTSRYLCSRSVLFHYACPVYRRIVSLAAINSSLSTCSR